MPQVNEATQSPEWQNREIYAREDGSYIIHDPHPYHVPNEGEWTDLWAKVTAYLIQNGITPDPEPLPPPPPPPTEEEKADEVRARRDALLAASDWTQLSDVPLSADQVTAWTDYRQALRDVTDQPGFPWEVEWPVAP